MTNPRHFILLVGLAIIVIVVGITGYMFIEGWTFLDAAFMTIITISTVGYHTVNGLSSAGRVFTIILIVMGVGLFFYIAGVMVQFMVEGRLRKVMGRRRLEKKIQKLKGHFIICGFGRIGKVLCQRLEEAGINLVVIEQDEKQLALLDDAEMTYVVGTATDEDNLVKAGIAKAKGLVAALGSDADDVFVVLSARQLNPELFIIARANEASTIPKLIAAGANKVVSPHDIGARRMADGILRPTVTDFLDLTFADSGHDIQMEEIPTTKNSRLAGVTLADSGIRQDLKLIIIAIKKLDGSMTFNPVYDARIYPGDTVIAVGRKDDLRKLEKILSP